MEFKSQYERGIGDLEIMIGQLEESNKKLSNDVSVLRDTLAKKERMIARLNRIINFLIEEG